MLLIHVSPYSGTQTRNQTYVRVLGHKIKSQLNGYIRQIESEIGSELESLLTSNPHPHHQIGVE